MPIIKLSHNLFEEEAHFDAGYSLIMGNKPDAITPEMIEKKLSMNGGIDLNKLGLFDSSTPNYTTYYPDVTAADLAPQEADFIYPVFRMLSMTIVNADSSPIDFGKPGVLKAAMPLAVGISINADHETALGNAMGAVKEVFWQNSYTDPQTGQLVPAGFNGVFKIDGKSNPRIARGIMMDPPSIHSNSVTVRFKWEKSHPNLTDEEFYMKWGEKDSEGKLIRKVATELIMFRETSLVGLGADPYAQVTNAGGKILDPLRGKRQYQNMLSAEKVGSSFTDKKEPLTSYSFSWKNHPAFQPIDESSFEYKPNNTKPDMEFSELVTSLGLDPAKFPDAASLKAHVESVVAKAEDLETQVNNLNTTVTNLTEKLPSAEVAAVLAKEGVEAFITGPAFDTNMSISTQYAEHITSLKATAVGHLKLLEGEAVAPELVAVIENADLPTLKVLSASYQKKLDDTMPLTCKSCNGHDISRASATKHKEGDTDEKPSMGQLAANFRKAGREKRTKNFAG